MSSGQSPFNATRDNEKEEDGDEMCTYTDRGDVCLLVKEPGNLLCTFATIWAYNQESSSPCPWDTGLDSNTRSGDPQVGPAEAAGAGGPGKMASS